MARMSDEAVAMFARVPVGSEIKDMADVAGLLALDLQDARSLVTQLREALIACEAALEKMPQPAGCHPSENVHDPICVAARHALALVRKALEGGD